MIGSHNNRAAIDHAVVIGAGTAGLLATRVLSEHCSQVTLIDRDQLPAQPELRKGAPQMRHIHLLLARGRQILDQLFPGFEAELTEAGALTIDVLRDTCWFSTTGWATRFRSEVVSYACTRALLEWNVRRRVRAIPNVRIIEHCNAIKLLTDPTKTRVTGVRVQHRTSPELPEEDLHATLVVDASGRSSRTPQWLQELGYQAPKETVVNAFLGYASRYYIPPPDVQTDWKLLVISGKAPDCSRGGALIWVEGHRWLATLGGYGHDYPPTDEEGFLAFAQRLRHPLLYDLIRRATPCSDIYGYRQTANRLYHYEQLARQPEQLLVLGDAVCCFNPVYGQGMTVAALAALVLDQQLRAQARQYPHGHLTGLARRFQKALAKQNQIPWGMAIEEDFRYMTTEGTTNGRGVMEKFSAWYFDQLGLLLAQNPAIAKSFVEVVHLLKPPVSLFSPHISLPVIRLWLQKRFADGQPR